MKIKCVKECKYLGIIIDDELKWTPHIDSVLQKLKRLLWNRLPSNLTNSTASQSFLKKKLKLLLSCDPM